MSVVTLTVGRGRGQTQTVRDALGEADFDELYASSWPAMLRVAGLLLGDAASAEDVVQDAFVNVYRRWPKMRDTTGAQAYLRTAVVNGARSAGRRRAAAARALERHASSEPRRDDGGGAEVADADAGIALAVRALPRRQREVLVLRYWADLSEADIAAALGITRGTVKSTAARGLAALQQRLEASDAER